MKKSMATLEYGKRSLLKSDRREGRCEGMFEMQWRGGTLRGLISIEIKDYAVAASPTVAARALLYVCIVLYIVRASTSLLLNQSIMHSIIPFISKTSRGVYVPRSRVQ